MLEDNRKQAVKRTWDGKINYKVRILWASPVFTSREYHVIEGLTGGLIATECPTPPAFNFIRGFFASENSDIPSASIHSRLIRVFFDGLCQPVNPGGIACYGYLIRKDGKLLHQEYGVAGLPFSRDATNNVAEYTALIKALEWLQANPTSEPVKIISDSELVVKQLKGEYKVKSRRLVPLFRRAASLKDSFDDIEITWVPREENKEADALTNRAYEEAVKRGAKKTRN